MSQTIWEYCLIPLLVAVTSFLVNWLNAKAAESKEKTKNEKFNNYIQLAYDTVAKCVTAINQTYVNTLKEKNAFDENAQKEAFSKCGEAVLKILSQEVLDVMAEFFDDLEEWLSTAIENEVNKQKKGTLN